MSPSLGSNNLTLIDLDDWSYATAPSVPSWAYDVAAAYLLVVGLFGIVSNGAVAVAFARTKSVS